MDIMIWIIKHLTDYLTSESVAIITSICHKNAIWRMMIFAFAKIESFDAPLGLQLLIHIFFLSFMIDLLISIVRCVCTASFFFDRKKNF